MENDIITGGSAFPVATDSVVVTRGMTLRDYFAAKAMQGMVATYCSNEMLSKQAYMVADAMIEARNGK